MLKKPEVGQIVVTKGNKCTCYASRFGEGKRVEILEADSPERTPIVGVRVGTPEGDNRWHCTKCLRRPKKGEIL